MLESTRRQFLVLSTNGALATVALAGCLGGGGEKRQEGAGEVEDAVRRSVTVDIDVEPNGGWTQITYTSGSLSASQTGDEIYAIVEAFVGAHADGYDLGTANVDVYNTDGVETGEWKIEEQWIDRYLDDTLTLDGVYQLALETIST